jgi:hypothetical protein
MEDLFSTVLTVIPIALFVGIRLLAEQRKKRKKEEQGRLAEILVSLSKDRPAQSVSVRSDEDEFDAHSLEPDDDEDAVPAPPPPRKPAARPLWETPPVVPSAVSAPLPTELAAFTPTESPAAAAFREPERRAPSPLQAAPAAADHRESSGVFGRLERLPPLKRAIALTELLGAPKGL